MVSRIFSILKGEFFMSLFEQINKDYVTAYKAKDTQRVSVLRMLKASVKNRSSISAVPAEPLPMRK